MNTAVDLSINESFFFVVSRSCAVFLEVVSRGYPLDDTIFDLSLRGVLYARNVGPMIV